MLTLNSAEQQIKTPRGKTVVIMMVAVILSVALAVYLGYLAVLAALAVGFLLVVLMPTTAVVAGISWILLAGALN